MNSIIRTISAPRLAVAALLCTGTIALAPVAHAEPGNGQGQGQTQPPGQAQAPSQGQPPVTPPQAPAAQSHDNGNGNGNGNGHTNGNSQGNSQGNTHGNGGGQGNGGGGPSTTSDPAGNNGTVKIAPLGDFDGIPNNTPHVGCTFLVEWYGFDEGADIYSTVSFAEHAPTTGVGMTIDGPSPVFVGEDPASGAGTDTGLDAREAYTLSFTGQPHPKQGYHVKLTIHTPGSIGNDSKSKVFWVEGCGPTTPTTATIPNTPQVPNTPNTPQTPQTANTPQAPQTANTPQAPEVVPETETQTPQETPEVLGVQAFAPNAPGLAASAPQQAQAQAQQALPTSVNAGTAGGQDRSPVSGTTSLLGMLLVLLGAASARLAWTRARG